MMPANLRPRALAVAAICAGAVLQAAGSPFVRVPLWVPLALAAVALVLGAARPAPMASVRTTVRTAPRAPHRPRTTPGTGLGRRSPR
ncbi:hypothetical protein [Streptomyces sp. NPDC047108]|uniref:hypothetical protein n=1 Tax=Streptomyces sp. NPDC047108 TaxID=3155025 RepID=UPI0033D86628